MNEIKLQLDEESLKKLAAESILAQLSDEKRADILRQAVEYLVEPQKGTYGGSTPSILQKSFEAAVRSIAHDVARELLGQMPEVRKKLKTIMADAFEKAMETDREKTIERISNSLVESMFCHGKERY